MQRINTIINLIAADNDIDTDEINVEIENADQLEAELAKFSNEELETLAVGDQADWPAIYDAHSDVNRELVHEAIDDIFMQLCEFN